MAKGLGKGLGALLGDFAPPAPSSGGIRQVPIQRVEPNPNQPRSQFDGEALQALADSIAVHGIIQPLSVREMPGEYYQIIAGERRWRAARLAGLSEVPVLVIEISERVGKSRPAVANSLRLLTLCPEVLAMVERGELSAGHARAIVALPGARAQLSCAQKVLALRLSVRQTEALCKKLLKEKAPEETPEPASLPAVDYYEECARDLSLTLGRRAKIVAGKRKGRVELEYYGLDDLQLLLDALETLGGKK